MEALFWDIAFRPPVSSIWWLLLWVTCWFLLAVLVGGVISSHVVEKKAIREYRVGDRVRHRNSGIVYVVTKVKERWPYYLILKNSRNEVTVFADQMKDNYLLLVDDQLTSLEDEATDLSYRSDYV